MINKKDVQSLTVQLNNMQILIQTYEEIAAMHMRKIRSNVLTSRSFIDELEEIYQQLQTSYQDEVRALLAKKKAKTSIVSKKNGKSVSVFLSANTRLYGDIVQQTFTTFLDYINKNHSDVVVIGKLGQNLMSESAPQQPFIYKDLPDLDVKPEELVGLLSVLLQYEKIYLFYGKFQTIASQKPYMLDVYGEQAQIATQPVEHIHYLFEPSLEKILQFFEQQIFATIIEQSFKESELAKFAARMVALDKATDNIAQRMKNVDLQRRILVHHLQNQKQQQAIISSRFWKTN